MTARRGPFFLFTNAKDITIGYGRIVYAEGEYDQAVRPLTSGWVLPGGKRTKNEFVAEDAARWIDRYTKEFRGEPYESDTSL